MPYIQQSNTVILLMQNFILSSLIRFLLAECFPWLIAIQQLLAIHFHLPSSLNMLEIKENSIEIAFKNSLLEINSFYILKYNPTVNTIQHIKMQYNAMPYNIIRHNAASTRTPIQTGSRVCIKYSLHRTRVLGKLTLSSRKCLNIVFFLFIFHLSIIIAKIVIIIILFFRFFLSFFFHI